MAEEDENEEFDLQIPAGTPNMEILLSEVLQLFPVKLIAPKEPEEPYYLAVRGDLASVQAAKEHIRKRLEEMVSELENKNNVWESNRLISVIKGEFSEIRR